MDRSDVNWGCLGASLFCVAFWALILWAVLSLR